MSYTIQYDAHGYVVPCDSCGCEAPTGEFDWPWPSNEKHAREKRPLCEFCSTTLTSRYTEYPPRGSHEELRNEIWKAAASVFNMLKHPPKE